MKGTACHYKKGDVIYREGSFEMWMYDLKSGTVGIYVNYGQPDEFMLTKVMGGPGATIGIIGLLDSMRRSATAVALDDVEAERVTGEAFADYFGDDPDALLSMMKNLSRRIRELTSDYLETCRALSEAVKKEENDKPEDGAFWNKVGKFVNDYAEALSNASINGRIY